MVSFSVCLKVLCLLNRNPKRIRLFPFHLNGCLKLHSFANSYSSYHGVSECESLAVYRPCTLFLQARSVLQGNCGQKDRNPQFPPNDPQTDVSAVFETLSLMTDIYKTVDFDNCTALTLINNILILILRDNVSMCVHCEKDLLVNLKHYLFSILHQKPEAVCTSVIPFRFLHI